MPPKPYRTQIFDFHLSITTPTTPFSSKPSISSLPLLSASLTFPATSTNPIPATLSLIPVPFSPSTQQPTMSDYVDQFDWGLDMDEDIDNVDWTTLKEEVMNGPYGCLWDDEQAADGPQPGDRCRHLSKLATIPLEIPPPALPDEWLPVRLDIYDIRKPHVCDADGCQKRFSRRVDLKRHKLQHSSSQRFSCTAQRCSRKGNNGFLRHDKLTDHILAGHDDDTLFDCPRCDSNLTRDVASMHAFMPGDNFRTCPLPRCCYKVHLRRDLDSLDKMQMHIREKHDIKARSHFANLLAERGYDYQSCQVFCPICPSGITFTRTEEFAEHCLGAHIKLPDCGFHESAFCKDACNGRKLDARMWKCKDFPSEIRKHRRTILRIWPKFSEHPVWKDVKNCKWIY